MAKYKILEDGTIQLVNNYDGQNFDNNFSELENKRFDIGVAMIYCLFSKQRWNEIENKIKTQMQRVNVLDNGSISGSVETTIGSDGISKSTVNYAKHRETSPLLSWHNLLHEMGHFVGLPNANQLPLSQVEKGILQGHQIYENKNGEAALYGFAFDETGNDLLAELAMSVNEGFKKDKPQITSTDDILIKGESFIDNKSPYSPMMSITRLMTVAMNNDFNNSYETLIRNGSGIIDSQIPLLNNQTGSIVEAVPTNDFLYGLTIDTLHTERQFDRYSAQGSYKNMCISLDNQMDINLETKQTNPLIVKEQLLKIADMFNNKMYIMEYNKCITPEQKNNAISQFNVVFNQALIQHGIGGLSQEDIQKTTLSMYATYECLRTTGTLPLPTTTNDSENHTI